METGMKLCDRVRNKMIREKCGMKNVMIKMKKILLSGVNGGIVMKFDKCELPHK